MTGRYGTENSKQCYARFILVRNDIEIRADIARLLLPPRNGSLDCGSEFTRRVADLVEWPQMNISRRRDEVWRGDISVLVTWTSLKTVTL